MYCPKCGEKLDDDAKFCTSCGENLEEDVTKKVYTSSDSTSNKTSENEDDIYGENKKTTSISKSKLKKLGIGAAILLLVLLLLRYFNNRPHEISLSDYYNVEFEGFDGYGKLNYNFDSEKFVNGNQGKIKYASSQYNSMNQDPQSIASDLANYIAINTDISVDKEKDISNGDEITLNFNNDSQDVENFYKVKIKNDSKKVKVEGLEPVKEVDPSAYFDVLATGIEPNAKIEITKKEDAPEYADLLRPSVDKSNNLSNGDEVEISYDNDDEYLLKHYGVVINPPTSKFTVEGLPSYVKSYANLADGDKKDIEEEAGYQLDDMSKEWTKATLSDKELIGTITVTPKDPAKSYSIYNNRIYLVYKLTAHEENDEYNYKNDFNYFTYVDFTDVIDSKDDQLYGEVNVASTRLRHLASMDEDKKEDIYYTGYYFMDRLVDDIRQDYNEEEYNYDISFNLDDYRISSDGIAGDYNDGSSNYLRLTEDGKAYYQDYSSQVVEGTYSEDGDKFTLKLRGVRNGEPIEGVITDKKKVRIPDLNGKSSEAFEKMY